MKIQSIRAISGPNVWNHRPVLIMLLDLEELAEVPSCDIPGFVQRLSERLPGIWQHKCSPGYEGGFIERLHRGTYFGHIVEHIALELSELSGIGVKYGKTVYGGSEGVYQVVVRYENEAAMRYLLQEAVSLAQATVDSADFSISAVIDKVRELVRRTSLGPSTEAIVQAAQKRNIPWERLNQDSLLQLGYGKYRRFIQATTTGETSDISVEIAQDKDFTKKLLSEASIPVPRGVVVRSWEEALEAFSDLEAPVTLKPVDGNHGNAVFLNLVSEAEVKEAFRQAQDYSKNLIMEEFFRGKDYRVLVVGGKVVAASERLPAHVVGDGKSSIEELVREENKNPLRGEGHEKALTFIKFDQSVEAYLTQRSLGPQSVPASGERIFLKATANLSTGGTATDVTDLIHPDTKVMCERAARKIGLDVCGIDLILEDISRSWMDQPGGIIEVNAGPGIRMHHHPSSGKARDVGEAIVDHLFPDLSEGRIPIIAVTGTNGKTTVSRLLAHIFQNTGLTVGNTTTDGIFINDQRIARGDTTGPLSARAILHDPGVEVAVLETARGGIVKRGLGFDWCDVGIITNIEADHIGQDGIEDIEDILRVKSLVVERVKAGGTIILNSAYQMLIDLIDSRNLASNGRKIVLFSLDASCPRLQDHLSRGGDAFYLKAGNIYEFRSGRESVLISPDDIPLTLNGTARFQVANALACIAACRAMNISTGLMLKSLMSFDVSSNAGRNNLYKVNHGYVLLDYGHNPDAILNIGEMVRSWNVSRVKAILGVPGDRSDEMIRLSGEAAGKVFSSIIIREDEDLRERQTGETARLLYEGIVNSNPHCQCVAMLDPYLSLEKAIENMEHEELIVYFYEDLQEVTKLLEKYEAELIKDYQFILSGGLPSSVEALSWQ